MQEQQTGIGGTAARRRELMRRMMAEAGLGPGAARLAPRDHDGPAPLSHAQQSMWLHHRTFPDSAAYNVCLLVRMDGPLDTGALERALRALIRRHAILRTLYRDAPDEPSTPPANGSTPASGPAGAAHGNGAVDAAPGSVGTAHADGAGDGIAAVQIVTDDDSLDLAPSSAPTPARGRRSWRRGRSTCAPSGRSGWSCCGSGRTSTRWCSSSTTSPGTG